MKKLLIIGIGALLIYSCKKENKDQKEETHKQSTVEEYSIEQFMDNETSFANGFSKDKSKVLMTSNRSGIFNIYTTPTKGGELMPITKSDSSSIYGIS